MYIEILLLVMGTGVTEVLMQFVVVAFVFNIVHFSYRKESAPCYLLLGRVMLMWYSHYFKTKQL